jgi:hypothetical protein
MVESMKTEGSFVNKEIVWHVDACVGTRFKWWQENFKEQR